MQALLAQQAYIAGEVLAHSIRESAAPAGALCEDFEVAGHSLRVGIRALAG
jgi:hypothetical protein